MTDRKRRKLADALTRLSASVGDIRALGDELSAIATTKSERKLVPLRFAAAPPSLSAPSSSSSTSTTGASLMALVPASALRDSETQDDEKENEKTWRAALTRLASELSAADPDAPDRCSRLMRRYDSLAGTVQLYENKLTQQTNDAAVSEKVDARLVQEEAAWEEAIEQREVQLAKLKVELRELQQAGQDDEEQKDDADADVVMESEVAALENQGLSEALALRQEEKRDIEAAIQSLQRKKRRRDTSAGMGGSGCRSVELQDELERLQSEKDDLKAAIYSMEAEHEQAEAEQHGVAALKEALEQSKSQREKVQDELDKQKHFLTRLKTKMKHMVDEQLLSARDTTPPTISEEVVILHLLYENAGEMDMNALKQATTEMLTTYGKTSSSAAVLRAIYSLVGSLSVHIDRSIGNGVVTSLLV